MEDSHKISPPGDKTSLKEKMLCIGSSMMEKFSPLKKICDHVVGIHIYCGELQRQIIAHHYCSILNDDFRQCVIYDSEKEDAKLIGVEYIISEKLFKDLPEDEKKYWHSHVYEVTSGMLVSPHLPDMAEHMAMNKLVNTYGKTFHFWQIDRGDPLPYGEPKIMMALLKDDQVNMSLLEKRDKECSITTADKKKNREDIIPPKIISGSDHWYHTGKAIKLNPTYFDVKHFSFPKNKV